MGYFRRRRAAAGSDDGRLAMRRWLGQVPVLLGLALLVFLCGAEARSPHPPPVRRLFSPRSSLSIFPRLSPEPLARPGLFIPPSPPPQTLKYSDKLRLTLSVPGLLPFDAQLLLRPTEHLFHPDARETIDGASRRLRSEDWWLFTGDVIHFSWMDRVMAEELVGLRDGRGVLGSASIIVHHPGSEDEEPVFEGSFDVHGVTYHILAREKYERLRTPLDVEPALVGAMVVFRDADMYHDDPPSVRHSCSHDVHPYNGNTYHPVWETRHSLLARDDISGGMTSSSNFVNSINSTAGCPTTQQIVYMGVALDCNYVSTYGGPDQARTQVLNDWNQVSALYKSTYNVSLGITEMVVMNETCSSNPGGEQWNVGCDRNLTLDQRLSLFSQWRGESSGDGIGLWHLMSACPTDSEVGVAWLGTLCQTGATLQSGSYVSGTGISTATKTEWSLVSHEIGHGFGAIHDCSTGCSLSGQCCPFSSSSCDAGGRYIMNPTTSSTETRFSGCTLGNICTNLGTRAVSSSCMQAAGSGAKTIISLQQCGNGIVEAGEECDPGSNSTSTCCDPSTCKFRTGAVCDPSSAACCTSSCQFSSVGTVCRPAVNSQCDIAETCTGSNATCPTDVTRPDGQSCGSSGMACASGTCTSLSLQCQTAGASMNLTTACGQRDDTSCVVTCRDPSNANQCIVLQTPLADGSPCGYGGHCYNQTCAAGSWQSQFDAMFTQNLQISIPVTIVVGLIILAILFLIARSLVRCCVGRRNPGPTRGTAQPAVPPPMRQSRRAVPPAAMQHSASLSSSDAIVQTGVIERDPSPDSNGRYNPNVNQGYQNSGPSGGYGQYDAGQQSRQNYPDTLRPGYGGAGGGGGGRAGGGGGGGAGWPQSSAEGQRGFPVARATGGGGTDGWIDEREYNGPYYGQREEYGR